MPRGKRPTALGTYIFAGGFTLGVREHFDILTHFEDGAYGVETAIRNGLIDFAFTDPTTWPVEDYTDKVDFLYGNPPCAPWSVASHTRQTHWTEDPRVNAVRRMAGLLETIHPRVWAWESVRPTFIRGRSLINTVVAQANELGYRGTALMVNAQNHGVPQIRKRMFIVLSRVHIEWQMPRAKNDLTVRDTIARKFKTETTHNVSEQDRLLAPLIKKMKPGDRASHVWDKLNPDKVREPGKVMKGRPGFLKYRMEWDEPSNVILGGATHIHPKENRYITVEETAALCGYPSNFKFYGTVGKQYAQVAQAVMPPVGEYLARNVAQAVKEGKSAHYAPLFERVEIFHDNIERDVLDTTLRMRDGLKLVGG